jgi:tape measure domain-containing protein
MAELEVRARFTASVADAIANLKALEKQVSAVNDSSEKTGGGMARMLGSVTKFGTIGVAALGSMATAAGVMGIKTAAANEQALISFETLLGSAGKAKVMFEDLQKFAATTPFEFPQLRDAASKLLTTGVAADRVIPIMTALGDSTSAMGTGAEGISRAVYALQQMNTAGKVTGQDMMQLASAGIPIWDALAGSIGKSVPEVRKLASEGALVANDVMTAIETYAGPAMSRVKGMMEVQSQSMMGLMSTLKDTIGIELGKMMQPAADELKKALPTLITMVSETLTAIGPSINKLVSGIFGTLQKLLPLLTPIFIGIGELVAAMMEGISLALDMVLPYISQIAPAFSNLAKIVRNLFTALAPVVSMLVATFAPIIVSLIGMVATLSGVFAGLTQHMNIMKPILITLVGLFVAYKTVQMALKAADMVKYWYNNIKALVMMVQTQGLLNAVTMLFPGIWLALAIAAVVAAIILMYKNWEWIWDKLKMIWNGLVTLVQGAINLVLGYWEFWINKIIDGVNLIIKAWNKLPFKSDIPTLDHVNMQLDITGAKLDRNATAAQKVTTAMHGTADAAERAAKRTLDVLGALQAVKNAERLLEGSITPAAVTTTPGAGAGSGSGGANKVVEAAKKRLDGLKKSMEDVTKSALEFGQALGESVNNALGVKTVFSADKAKASLEGFAQKIAGVKKVTPALVTEFEKLNKSIGDDLVAALNSAKKQLDDAKAKFDDFKKSVGNAIAGVFGTLGSAYESMTKSQNEYKTAQAETVRAQEALNNATESSAELVDALAKAQAREALAAQEAGKSFLERMKEQAEAGQKFAEQIKKLISMGLSEGALQQVLASGSEAGGKIAEELIAGGTAIIDQTNSLIQSAQSAADEVGGLAASRWYQAGVDNAQSQIDGLVAQVAELTPLVMAAMDTLAEKMKRQAVIDIKISKSQFKVDVFVTKHIKEIITSQTINVGKIDGARAAGGPVRAGGTYLVGENGPELFSPNSSGNITPNGVGGTVNITVNAGMGANGADIGDQIVDALKRYQRRNGALPLQVS